jgi:flagellar biosynthetic protein FliQ
MTPESVMSIGEHALTVTAILAAPLLLSALIVGLVIGMLQAATQINEATLSFIPKLLVVVVTLFATGHWMLQTLMDYTRSLFESIPGMIG